MNCRCSDKDIILHCSRKGQMGKKLSSSWNFPMASGELISSLFLVFSIMAIIAISKYQNNKKESVKITKIMQSCLFSISGLVSIFLGKALGNLLSSHNQIIGDQGVGMTTPLFAILIAFHYGIFDSLPMVIGFQAIGALFGVGLYLLFAMAFKAQKKSFDWTGGLVINNKDPKTVAPMEFIAQATLAGVMMLLSSISSQVIGSNVFTNSFLLIFALFLVLMLFSATDFFILSPFIELYSLIIGSFVKKTTKKNWINLVMQLSIHIGVGCAIGGIEYQIRY